MQGENAKVMVEQVVHVRVAIPVSLHRAVRAKLVRRGVTMQEWLTQIFQAEAQEPVPSPNPQEA